MAPAGETISPATASTVVDGDAAIPSKTDSGIKLALTQIGAAPATFQLEDSSSYISDINDRYIDIISYWPRQFLDSASDFDLN